MKRSAFPIRRAPALGVVALFLVLAIVALGPAVAYSVQEPIPRDTPTPAPYLQLSPSEGPEGIRTRIVATGALWVPGGNVVLYWDSTDHVVSNQTVNGDGTFQTTFESPNDPVLGSPGAHTVIAVEGGLRAEATFIFVPPTPTPTPSPTVPPPPSDTPKPIPPTPTRAPTLTFTPRPTLTPSPTLRPVTPMVTITPIPPTRAPVGPARTNTPVPPTRTSAPAATATSTPQPGTLTFTPTPSVTPTPSHTPGPGTPSVTPQATSVLAQATATATPVQEIADTGAGTGVFLLLGLVMAGLVVGFRLLRVRSLAG